MQTNLVRGALLSVLIVSVARADYRNMIGYPELQSQLGGSIPTGYGIGVQQVEAPDGASNYSPGSGGQFTGKTITLMSGASGTSTHAQTVGINFYGNVSGGSGSIAPQIGNDASNPIRSYEAGYWIGNFLFPGGLLNSFPASDATSRVVNHSWVGALDTNANTAAALRQFDYLINRDDLVQVGGLPNTGNSNSPLWKTAYNGISVGRTDGNHISGTNALDAMYTSGRTAPLLVAPSTATSYATPMVSAAAALLIESAAENPGFSLNRTYTNGVRTITEGESSEVVKATLMAGADRLVDNPTGADITSYTVNTSNNLNSTYGAGQVNIFNSYNILAGGQHDSDQDRGSSVDIGQLGWDYDPAFGGAAGTNDTGSYFFTPNGAGELTAALVWNLRVYDNSMTPGFQSAAELFNLDLLLVDIDGGHGGGLSYVLPASSQSTVENTENLYFTNLIAGNRYEMRVALPGSQADFNWDYALAWQMVTVPEPAGFALALVAFAAACRITRGRRNSRRTV